MSETGLLQWRVGDVMLTKLPELEMTAPGGGAGTAIPDAYPKAVRAIPWLAPDFADERGHLRMSVHALLVEAPGLKLVVDTCVGNHKRRSVPFFNGLSTDFLERMARAGWARDDVQAVLCTHLHVDHVGWNTVLEQGKWVPTFPHAQYLFGRAEYLHWQSSQGRGDTQELFRDSVQPVLDAGQARFVEVDERLSPEIRLIPTPGHTPGHVSVVIESAGQTAVITGDIMHHPCQVAHPEWSSGFDSDPALSRDTRRGFLSRFAGSHTLVVGTHFAGPTAGTLVREGAGYRLVPVGGAT